MKCFTFPRETFHVHFFLMFVSFCLTLLFEIFLVSNMKHFISMWIVSHIRHRKHKVNCFTLRCETLHISMWTVSHYVVKHFTLVCELFHVMSVKHFTLVCELFHVPPKNNYIIKHLFTWNVLCVCDCVCVCVYVCVWVCVWVCDVTEFNCAGHFSRWTISFWGTSSVSATSWNTYTVS